MISLHDDDEYRKKILKLFSLHEYDETIISNKMNNLFNKVIKHERYYDIFELLLKKKANMILSEDLGIGFIIMYSYDTIDMFSYIVEKMLHGNKVEWEASMKILNNYYDTIK